jgi:hypothetical protein
LVAEQVAVIQYYLSLVGLVVDNLEIKLLQHHQAHTVKAMLEELVLIVLLTKQMVEVVVLVQQVAMETDQLLAVQAVQD